MTRRNTRSHSELTPAERADRLQSRKRYLEVLGEPGNPPIRFEIRYDPSRIDPRRRYAVRTRIMVSGKPFLTTDQHHAVLTGGKGNEVELLLGRRVYR